MIPFGIIITILCLKNLGNSIKEIE